MLGVTHPGLQPVTVEPQLIPLLLHFLKLAPQLLDLLLGCSEEGKVSQGRCERSGPRIRTLGVNRAGKAWGQDTRTQEATAFQGCPRFYPTRLPKGSASTPEGGLLLDGHT